MDQKMRLIRGDSVRFSVTIGAGALNAGDPFMLASGLAVAVTDGLEMHGVLVNDGAISETKVPAELLVPGQIWEVTVASLTMNAGVRVASASSLAFDAGTTTNPSIGWTIDPIVTADVTAKIFIAPSTIA